MNRHTTRILSVAAGGVVLAGAAAGAGAGAYAAFGPGAGTTIVRQVTVPAATQASASSSKSVSEIYEQAHEGVVEITVTTGSSTQAFPGQQSERQQAQGSGFVYDDEGHIVTNQHVVDGATSVSVRFWNGDTYDATVVGSDPSTDLAVIKVNAPASLLSPIAIGDSGELEVGDGVIAIGSPLGLEETLTTGVVSALERQMEAPNGYTINDSIQTDAAINHGNSGGPLLDLDGEVVGVNAQIASDSGGNDGIGFAIPSSTLKTIAPTLIADGKVEHAYLGVSLMAIPSSAAERLGSAAGVEVAELKSGSPAADAGLKAATGSRTVGAVDYPTGGDVITAVDGQAVATAEQLQTAIDAKQPGDTVSLTVVRGGEQLTVDVELTARPA